MHNRRETTRRCLAHLQALDIPSWARVLVVDDGSSDGTGAMIQSEFPWVELLHGSGDLWWAGAIHQGMRHAIAKGADCICWLNDDCLPDAHTLPLLVAAATSRGAICGAVCGAVCRGTDGRQMAYGGGFITDSWPAPLHEPLPSENAIPVHWLHGNLVAIPAAAWRRIGLPEYRCMRHNLSDIDYTHLAHRCGIPVLLLSAATAVTEINENLSYRSWAAPETTAWDILAGLWHPRVWWYAPGLACFLFRLLGWRAAAACLRFSFKLAAAVVVKCLLPPRWVSSLKKARAA